MFNITTEEILVSYSLGMRDFSLASLSGADLRGANLSGANLDFSSIPMWCGGTNIKLDRHLALQLIYHLFNQQHDDLLIKEAIEPLRPLAQAFIDQHHTDAPALRTS